MPIYIAISNFVLGGGGVLFYFIPEPNKNINIFPFPHLWTFIILFMKEKETHRTEMQILMGK